MSDPTVLPAVTWADPQRRAAFHQWLDRIAGRHALEPASVRPASADASFRRYLRIDAQQGSLIIMDAPPEKENCRPFVKVAGLMADAGLNVPRVLEWDEAQGFMLLDDLGERACQLDRVGNQEIAVFWFGPTKTAVAFSRTLEGRTLTFYADEVSPESAPFKDKETGTRWTLAGRGVDGPLKGKELTWAPSIQCHWAAWSSEYPKSAIIGQP